MPASCSVSPAVAALLTSMVAAPPEGGGSSSGSTTHHSSTLRSSLSLPSLTHSARPWIPTRLAQQSSALAPGRGPQPRLAAAAAAVAKRVICSAMEPRCPERLRCRTQAYRRARSGHTARTGRRRFAVQRGSGGRARKAASGCG
eukprot:scaffold70018_cov75-Phaeocystis_antarctica.AAC.2